MSAGRVTQSTVFDRSFVPVLSADLFTVYFVFSIQYIFCPETGRLDEATCHNIRHLEFTDVEFM